MCDFHLEFPHIQDLGSHWTHNVPYFFIGFILHINCQRLQLFCENFSVPSLKILYFNPSKHSGNYILICNTAFYLWISYGSHSKQRLFPQTALTS
jgi:hypothetical protein